jgi:hypothetical protein
MRIAKEYLLFSGLSRKKVGLTRVRIAKKIHSSLLVRLSDCGAAHIPKGYVLTPHRNGVVVTEGPAKRLVSLAL